MSTQSNNATYLPECNKVIYAVGFEKRHNIVIDGYKDTRHNPAVGIIGPGLSDWVLHTLKSKQIPWVSLSLKLGYGKFMTVFK